MPEKVRINFVLPACPRISGGPLAILEYANRLADRGHHVTLTTNPDSQWQGESPFPWFQFKGDILYVRDRQNVRGLTKSLGSRIKKRWPNFRPPAVLKKLYQRVHDPVLASMSQPAFRPPVQGPFDWLLGETPLWMKLIEVMPDCDLNIATLWSTVFPVYFSGKGKPVYFMQHYEEVFYDLQPETVWHRLAARMSYGMPVYKVANSSWLQKVILEKYGQKVPFSNNGIELKDFAPRAKKSENDGIIRIFTYARPEQWKGFADAVAVVQKVQARAKGKVEWHVFGYKHPDLSETNPYAPYTYHPRLSFKELAELYATSDIALCPSWYESFPLPALEAMASGTSVVTTAYGTEDYAFHEKNALVVGSRDIDGMARALERLINDPSLRQRLAAEGRKTSEGFDWEGAVVRREAILLAIHRGETAYDIFRPAKLGLEDAFGVEFERAPADVEKRTEGLYAFHQRQFLSHGGVARVVDPKALPDLLQRGFPYMEPDFLDIMRTPLGPPIDAASEIPNDQAPANPTTPLPLRQEI